MEMRRQGMSSDASSNGKKRTSTEANLKDINLNDSDSEEETPDEVRTCINIRLNEYHKLLLYYDIKTYINEAHYYLLGKVIRRWIQRSLLRVQIWCFAAAGRVSISRCCRVYSWLMLGTTLLLPGILFSYCILPCSLGK